MILILTTEAGDYSHAPFIDWLEFHKADYLILTGEGILNGRYDVSYHNKNLYINKINITKKHWCPIKKGSMLI